jgi:hypothetical protein
MENNINILTREEQTQIRLALVSAITELERMVKISKQYNIDSASTERQLSNNITALEKFRKANNFVIVS